MARTKKVRHRSQRDVTHAFAKRHELTSDITVKATMLCPKLQKASMKIRIPIHSGYITCDDNNEKDTVARVKVLEIKIKTASGHWCQTAL